ncbi:MAG TPA: hypothetical protein VFP35_02200 [Candidatus Saccharimonadales bacterium]|nr:hypothetical protein [Candidatus Saccharimonadales bacterium]
MSFDTTLVILIALGLCFYFATSIAVMAVREHFRRLVSEKKQVGHHLFYGTLAILLAAFFYFWGIIIMATKLNAGQETAVIIAVIMLGFARACWRRKKNRLISRLACLGLAGLALLLLAAAF